MNVTKTKCPIVILKVSKSEFFGNFGPLIEHSPHWINFTIIIFISEKSRYYRCLYKNWNKIISFDTRKKKGNQRKVIGKMKKKVNLSP
jgi:hypothetical protein